MRNKSYLQTCISNKRFWGEIGDTAHTQWIAERDPFVVQPEVKNFMVDYYEMKIRLNKKVSDCGTPSLWEVHGPKRYVLIALMIEQLIHYKATGEYLRVGNRYWEETKEVKVPSLPTPN